MTFLRDPDRTIPEETVRRLEHEAELARQRNVVIDGRVLPVEPPEKRANEEAGRDVGSSAPSITGDALRPDDVLGNLLEAQPGEPLGSRWAYVETPGTSRDDAVRGELRGSIDQLTSAEKAFVEDQLHQGKNITIIPRSTIEGERTADFYIDGEKVELKTVSNAIPTSEQISSRIAKEIQGAAGQSKEVVVIDARAQQGMDLEIAFRAIRKYVGRQKQYGTSPPLRVEILTPAGKLVY